MTTEFTFYNNSDQLTLSADGITHGYIGRATNTSVVQPTTGTPSKACGYSTYTITYAGDIVVALPLKTTGDTCLANVTRSGDVHTITVYQTVNGTGDAAGFKQQEATEVFVFGAPNPAVETACCLFDNSGNVVADLTRRPLTYAGLVSLGSGVTNTSMPSVSVPAIVGMPSDYKRTSSSSPPYHILRSYIRGWTLISGALWRANIQFDWQQEDAAGSVLDDYNPVDAIIIEASGL
jgi:hypothetical protein